MPFLAEQHLAKTEQLISETEVRVTQQRLLIDRLAAAGHDTAEAEALLAKLLANLDNLRAHRETILAKIAAKQGKPPLP